MYEIQTKDSYGIWSPEVGDVNEFETEEAAWEMVENLKTLGDEWAEGEYRVVEIEAQS